MSDEDKVEIRDPEGLLAAYEKAKADLVDLRAKKKELEDQYAEAMEQFSEENLTKWRTRAVREATKNALEAEGIKNPDRILKYLNLDGVDFDDKEALQGLEPKLQEVKTDFPELFDVKRRAGSQSADIHANKPVQPPVSGTEAQVARIFAKH